MDGSGQILPSDSQNHRRWYSAAVVYLLVTYAQFGASEATAADAGQLQVVNGLDLIQIQEAATVIHATVSRSGGSMGAVSVSYATSSGSAVAGADFVAASGTLTWADGDTLNKVISVSIFDDALVEGNEDFTVELSNPTGGATIPVLGNIQLVRILDDEAGVSFASGSTTIAEAAGPVNLTVSRTGDVSAAASVDYASASGTATGGSDFTSESGTLNWAAGDATDKTITIGITDDASNEGTETFTVALSNPSGTSLGPSGAITVTISDDDAPTGGGGGGGGALEGIDLAFLLLLSLRRRRSS